MSMRMGRSLAIQFDQMLVVIVLLRGDLGCGGGGWVWSGCAYCWVLWERRMLAGWLVWGVSCVGL
jgi:hypothetical protein